jgi:hypothetical protein
MLESRWKHWWIIIVSFSKTLKSEIKQDSCWWGSPKSLIKDIWNLLQELQLPVWSVDSYLPCMMYVLTWIWITNNLFLILQMFPTTVGNSWELEDLAVYIGSRWLKIRPIYFTMELIFSDSWAQSWARLFFWESRILYFIWCELRVLMLSLVWYSVGLQGGGFLWTREGCPNRSGNVFLAGRGFGATVWNPMLPCTMMAAMMMILQLMYLLN